MEKIVEILIKFLFIKCWFMMCLFTWWTTNSSITIFSTLIFMYVIRNIVNNFIDFFFSHKHFPLKLYGNSKRKKISYAWSVRVLCIMKLGNWVSFNTLSTSSIIRCSIENYASHEKRPKRKTFHTLHFDRISKI